MATIALSAVGMALGGSIGGSVLGLSMATIGRAAGAALGRRIDAHVLGQGSEPIEVGRVDRFRVTGAAEGADMQQVYGRMRVAGQVIWASQFLETSSTSGGGKGAPSAPKTTTYAYSVSLALALCEGEIGRIGRIWADGTEIAPNTLNLRVYTGTMDQLPDPKIAAVEGMENTPAYRGTAYVVLEDLALGPYGNRIPQLTFEVIRPAPAGAAELPELIKAAALIPGTGEYALATTPVHLSSGFGAQVAANVNTPLGGTDFDVALDALQGDLPQCQSMMLAVAWFGDDLRCGQTTIAPMVTQTESDATAMPWAVSGITRAQAVVLPQIDGAPIHQGTPADAAVVQAITAMTGRGLSPVMAPQILMTQLPGNTLTDPWTGTAGQPALAWHGQITGARAPGVDGSPDGTALATAEVADFMGTASPGDFSVAGTSVSYTGPATGGYRRFILHYAHLCAAAGGVDGFLIGSGLAGLSMLRDAVGGFPFVEALRVLAADVRGILGPACKISYAADWREYGGMSPTGTDDKIFHLDPLWADPNVDFVGINGYFPLADWRDGQAHLDADHRAIHDLAYLQGNVAGGEAFDWHYPTPEARAAQRRVPITDAGGEPWIWRPKDLVGWWQNPHHNRIDGIRSVTPTDWQPGGKPIWLTETGCPAVDKGANQPDRTLQAGATAVLPMASTGARDDLMQMQYLTALHLHFADPANNPISDSYGAPMLDTGRIHVWGWDARPYPFWPGNQAQWSDGARYGQGPWLNGRASSRSLASVVAEICDRAGVASYDTSALFGVLRGYTVADAGSGRAALQPLMLAYGFDVVERDGTLIFQSRRGVVDHHVADAMLAFDPEAGQSIARTRAAGGDSVGRVQMAFLHADGDYAPIAVEDALPDEVTLGTARSEVPLALTRAEGQATVARWLQETRAARETLRFALPPSCLDIGAGDVIGLASGRFRIDRVEEAGLRLIEATAIAEDAYVAPPVVDDPVALQPHVGPAPAEVLFLDLPLVTGDELPHAPHLAAAGRPWPGAVAVYGAPQDSDYALDRLLSEAATIGITRTALHRGPVGVLDRQTALEVALVDGQLSSVTDEGLLAGGNMIAIGDGGPDNWEVLQFQTATPLYTRGYGLSGLLRGQLGSFGLMPDVWPAGSQVVLLGAGLRQLDLPAAARGTARHFRYGPAAQPITDAGFRYASHAFAGNGLRPYPVVHLTTRVTGAGRAVSWIRCSRIDGDIWADGEIPLGEDSERYHLRVTQGGTLLREASVTSPTWTYPAADIAAEVGPGSYEIAVAQLSDRYGAGPYTTVTL